MNEVSCTVSLALKTCMCGTVYAVPHWVTSHVCPTCGSRRRLEMQDKIDELYDEIYHLNRVIAGQKGAINKKNKRKGKP